LNDEEDISLTFGSDAVHSTARTTDFN